MSSTLMIKNGDVVVSSATGRPVTISGLPLLKQHLTEMLSINTLPNGFGAGIPSLVGLVPDNSGVVPLVVDQNIRSSVNAMIQLQNNGVTDNYLDTEKVSSVAALQVAQVSGVPTDYAYKLDIASVAGATVTRSGTFGA